MQEVKSIADLEKIIAGGEPVAPAQEEAQAPAALDHQPVEEVVITKEDAAASAQTIEQLINETIVEEKAPAAEVVQEKPSKVTTREAILDQINVDPNAIQVIASSNPLGTFQELDNLFLKPSYEVIALQSGYRASFRPMNNDDMLKVRKFTGTEREQHVKLFNFVFSRMVNSGLGKSNFETFLKVTAEEDFETLIYGLYCATFPEESDYDVTCPHCRKLNKARIGKESLIRALDVEKTGAYISDILSKNYAPIELIKHSVVAQVKRVVLPKSKIIVDIKTPTLYNFVSSLQQAESFANYEPEMFTYLKYAQQILIPVLQSFAEGRPEYIRLESIEDKLRCIVDMPPSDRKALDAAITEKNSTYKVEYKLPDLTCGGCGQTIKNIVVDMVETLFVNMARA
jgi:hypothetical protein